MSIIHFNLNLSYSQLARRDECVLRLAFYLLCDAEILESLKHHIHCILLLASTKFIYGIDVSCH